MPQNVIVRKLTKYERQVQEKYVPNELAAQKKFQADQEALRSIPTEAPGWIYNKTAADMFRNKIISGRFGNGNFLVTQENTPVNSVLRTYFRKPKKIKVKPKDRGRFPKESPFKTRHFSTCSVVGNGGILKGSGCGEEIDASEFVFRCNTAPLDNIYWEDVGKRTNFITMNPGMVSYRYDNFGKSKKGNSMIKRATLPRKRKAMKEGRDKFLRDLSVYADSYLFIEAFLYELNAKRAFLAHEVLRESHAKNTVIYPHPDFVRSTHSYWQERGVKAPRASTGLLVVTVATQMCDEVRLYGFWPFHSDRNNTRLTEHYYDNALPSNSHKITDEFKELQRLHNAGVIRLTTHACQ
ncbi:alpha-2,8-sialyltransferase 8F-like isoform X2 [Branchiostoma floridae x Branchiostoma belcheri]